MCGIAGIYAYRDSTPPVDREELLRIREQMRARGPDGAGVWISDNQRVGLAHRRLAIIDLGETGAQPMWNAQHTLCITFNGEIYNYRELRRELQAKGYAFRTKSDTEVLLHLYDDRGANMVHALRGMYAFAIWDDHNQGLFLARDPFGIKPLYYSDDGGTLRLASQVKALIAGGQISSAPEPAGHVGFFLLGSVPEPFTTFRAIRALPAGSSTWVDRRGLQATSRFFDIGKEIRLAEARAARIDGKEREELLQRALSESVQRHLVADVPVGMFLSSGLDSSTIASLAAGLTGGDLRAITLGFREFEGTADDETVLAAEVAHACSAAHEVCWIRQEDFVASLDHILDSMDQPSIDGVNTYFVAKVASEAGMKVAMSGIGGDELFGGYPSFVDVPGIHRAGGWARGMPWLGRGMRRLAAPIVGRSTSPKYAGLLEYGGTMGGSYLLRRGLYMPWELPRLLGDSEFTMEGLGVLDLVGRLNSEVHGIRSPCAAVAVLEHAWYMRNQLIRDADWAGMAHSLEIRVPLVDLDLFKAVAPMLAGPRPPGKAEMAAAVQRPLPPAIMHKPKTGFSVPVARWMIRVGGVGSGVRGLRGWAKRVNPTALRPFNILALVTDAYGGHGGIAKFNRDLLGAISEMPRCEQIIAMPRLIHGLLEPVPDKIKFVTAIVNSKLKFLGAILRMFLSRQKFDIVVCGHINLLPLAYPVALWKRCPVLLVIHGIDAWQPSPNVLVNMFARRVSGVLSVSKVTLDRFAAWSKIDLRRCRILPNCVDLSQFHPGPKPRDLIEDLGLSGKTVLLTVGRLSERERYKGFDEVMEALPQLAVTRPDVVYVIAGEGPDGQRLKAKALSLGVADRVRFLGFIPEQRKPDYYRLADAYVMPSRGEGFGIVFLEALACGIPVLGSTMDGSREALLGGELGILVNPAVPSEILRGIEITLSMPIRVPDKLEYYSWNAYRTRVTNLMLETLAVSD